MVARPDRLKVLFASAEFAPIARVGGLAAAAAGLVDELRRSDVDVHLVLPDYFATKLTDEQRTTLRVPAWAGPAFARSGTLPGVGEVTLIEAPGIARPHPYLTPDGTGWPDNDQRFMHFCAGVAALSDANDPDVLHLNDWHTSATLGLVRTRRPSMLTIHTLGYQGQADSGWTRVLTTNPEAFVQWGAFNPLAGGIRLADVVVAVSPNYAAEITTERFGAGLDSLLRDRGDHLVGIRNGIDTAMWNPAYDAHLPAAYSAGDLAGKLVCRAALHDEMGLVNDNGPLISVITRLVDQKGVDLILPTLPFLTSIGARLAVLGDGDRHLATALHDAAAQFPGRVSFRQGYDDGLAHRITAGSDLFLMPSRFEPCGLAQMQALRYGTLPVVTDVGGLHDTVIDLDAFPVTGTGIVVPSADPVAVLDGMYRGARVWGNARRRQAAQRRGMTADWSWTHPAQIHLDLYRSII